MILAYLRRLRRLLLEHRERSLSVRLAAARDELDYLNDCYREDPYNQDLHADIIHERARIADLEERRNQLNDQRSVAP